MRKTLSVVLAMVMLLSTLFTVAAVPAFAANAVTLTVGSVSGQVGDVVEVPVTVSDNHYLVNGQIFVNYDATALEIQAVSDDEDNPYLSGINATIFSEAMYGSKAADGQVHFVFASSATNGKAAGGTLFTLSFKILEGATGSSALTLSIKELRSNSGDVDYNTEPQLASGAVTVTEVTEPTYTGVVEIDGELYAYDSAGNLRVGKIWVTALGSNGLVNEGWVYTDASGRIYNNEFALIDGTTYYMVKGAPATDKVGVQLIDGEYYNISYTGAITTGKIWVTMPNGLTEEGWHYADETGRFYNNEFVDMVDWEDGVTVRPHYMEIGQATKSAGVREINGDYYYINWKGQVLAGKIWVTNTNGLTVEGWHYTDEAGCLYNDELVELVDENDGKTYTYYLVMGRIYNEQYGCVQFADGIYYITWEGKVMSGEVYVTYNNGLIETTGWHYTDETGRFLNNEFTTASDGQLYFIVNGAKYTTTGLMEFEGNYYYIAYDYHVVTNMASVSTSSINTNGLDIPAGNYSIDENGVFHAL